MPTVESDSSDLINVSRPAYPVMSDNACAKADEYRVTLREACALGKALEHTLELPGQFGRNGGVHR